MSRFTVEEVPPERLPDYARVPISFRGDTILEVRLEERAEREARQMKPGKREEPVDDHA